MIPRPVTVDQEFAQLKVIGMSNLLNVFYDTSACDGD
jgi:hypothetical protein